MELQHEIKQKKFKSEYEKLIVNILFTSSWLGGLHHQLFKRYGLSHQQYNVLRILRGQHPAAASISLITDRMLDKNSNASRLVDKLLSKKYIERTVSAYDRRQKDICITKKGLALLAEMDPVIGEFVEQFQCISVEEAEQLNLLLDRLRG